MVKSTCPVLINKKFCWQLSKLLRSFHWSDTPCCSYSQVWFCCKSVCWSMLPFFNVRIFWISAIFEIPATPKFGNNQTTLRRFGNFCKNTTHLRQITLIQSYVPLWIYSAPLKFLDNKFLVFLFKLSQMIIILFILFFFWIKNKLHIFYSKSIRFYNVVIYTVEPL